MMKNKIERHVKPSEFYWGVYSIIAFISLNLYCVNGKGIFTLLGAILLFICGMVINYSRKIKEKLDYE